MEFNPEIKELVAKLAGRFHQAISNDSVVQQICEELKNHGVHPLISLAANIVLTDAEASRSDSRTSIEDGDFFRSFGGGPVALKNLYAEQPHEKTPDIHPGEIQFTVEDVAFLKTIDAKPQ